MGRGGQKQQVRGGPVECPAGVADLDARERLGDPVAVRLADREVGLAVGPELVALVEDAEVVGLDGGFLKPGEGAFAGEGIDADDDQVAAGPRERVARLGVGPDDDAEVEPEQGPQLALPVAHEPGGRDDQNSSQEASGEHLADVEPGHDGLARPRLISQEKAEAGLGQHVVVDRDPLVGQRVDHRDFGREGGVEQMGVGRAAPPRRRPGRFPDRR